MALTFSVVDTWDDGKRIHVRGTIAKRFGRRLAALGWVRDDAWTPYCFRLRAIQK